MKKLFLSVAILFFVLDFSSAQTYNANTPPNEFNSPNNPLYWKNRPPFAGYWQQDIYYKIKATIHEKTNIIEGNESLTYWNNSPDTLAFVYFHLYQNAFVKGSHLEDLNLNNNFKQHFGKYETAGLGENVSSITVDGKELKTELDNTVMKVYLDKPLLPNSNLTFEISFKTYYDDGDQRRRMKMWNDNGFTHYDGVHWYPRICVYDRKLGWDTEQHLGKEFYGDFGTYDVELNFASNYVVEASGTLQNEKDVLPKDLQDKLDMKNFASKPWESKPSIITPYDSTKRKTWKYYAENVHDFAFTADPNYRIGESSWNGIKVVAIAQEQHCIGWANTAEFTALVIKIYSEDFGMYGWPKIVVADAQDGMEYNMITLDGGWFPQNISLLTHEVGHEWFYGQVANNETYRAALDEGFTQFLDSWCMLKLIGENDPKLLGNNKYENKFYEPTKVLNGEVYNRFMNDAVRGKDESINQISDGFNGALNHGGGYSHVYMKTATMLWNLQYVLGDSLFSSAMKHYFNQWKFCHPYFEDFRNSIIQYTHVDLNWFFDEWMETTKTIDYGITNVKRIRTIDSVAAEKISHQNIFYKAGQKVTDVSVYKITFKRYGRSEMPIDFSVYDKRNYRYNFHIPNTWFIKKTNATVLSKWYGWDKLHPTYDAYIVLPIGEKLKNVIIDDGNKLQNTPMLSGRFVDTTNTNIRRLADVDMTNNAWRPQTHVVFDSHIYHPKDWTMAEQRLRPDLWYNAVDGLKIGFHEEGDYMNFKNIYSITEWYGTGLGAKSIFHYSIADSARRNQFPLSYNMYFKNNINKVLKNTNVEFWLKDLDGLLGESFQFTNDGNTNNIFYLKFDFSLRYDSAVYSLFPEEWDFNKINNSISVGLKHTYNYFKGSGEMKFDLRSSTLWSDYNYAYATFSCINRNKLDKGKIKLDTRFFVRIGSGTPPPQANLYLSGASGEELADNKYTRAIGFVPPQWLDYGANTNHFQQGGGLNLRGYAGYLTVEENKDGNTYLIYKGNSGAAINAELDFDGLFKFHPKLLANTFHLDTYLFGDAGVMDYVNNANEENFSYPRADAGIGVALTIKKFWILDDIKPLVIRFDMPFFLNSVPYADPKFVKFRYVIGVNRAF